MFKENNKNSTNNVNQLNFYIANDTLFGRNGYAVQYEP